MINKNATINIDSSTPSTGKINQSTIDSIKSMSNDPKWIEAMKKMNETTKGRGRSKL